MYYGINTNALQRLFDDEYTKMIFCGSIDYIMHTYKYT